MNQDNLVKIYLDTAWRANLAVVGATGLPNIQKAGNVVRPFTQVRLSLRVSPTKDWEEASRQMVDKLSKNVPYNAKVTISNIEGGHGWCQKEPETWLTEAIGAAG